MAAWMRARWCCADCGPAWMYMPSAPSAIVCIGNHHFSSLSSVAQRNRPADRIPGSGDECDLARQQGGRRGGGMELARHVGSLRRTCTDGTLTGLLHAVVDRLPHEVSMQLELVAVHDTGVIEGRRIGPEADI